MYISENIVLPKGTDIIMSFIRMNRNEKYWPKPLMFDPDRFLSEKAKNHQFHYYMPFSIGPRNCIGTYELIIKYYDKIDL